MMRNPESGPTAPRPRLLLPDLARAVALVGMAVFHFTFDLMNFGFIPWGTIFEPGWMNFARLVAGSFVFLAGVSLVLAHGRGLRMRPFLTRLGKLVAAAALVSAATYALMPQEFIYFGILHSIAVSSLIGAALLSLPWPALAALGVGAVWVHLAFASPAFDHPWLWWIGLSEHWRPSMDFEPVLPWTGPFLWGMAVAKLARASGWLDRTPRYVPGDRRGALRVALFAGRHTLPIYLIHQPVLFGAVWAAALLLR